MLRIAIAMLAMMAGASAHEPHQQYADFFNEQVIPGTAGPGTKGKSCCNDRDAAFATERIQDGRLQVKWFDHNTMQTTDWVDVPDETIIQGKHTPTNEPAVWWGYKNGGEPFVRCFMVGQRY